MLNLRRLPSYVRHLAWYLAEPGSMPLCSGLDRYLPLPDLKRAKVLWPNRYSWRYAASRLDPIRKELSRYLPVEPFDVRDRDLDWHSKGGFPVPHEKRHLVGRPCSPVGPNDIRGEIFELQGGGRVVRCAFDYSDYPIVSSEIRDGVDVYFKCIAPPGPLPSNVVRIGYFAKNPRLLALARAAVLQGPARRRAGIYGRFGTLTDSQPLRQAVVHHLSRSGLDFIGGFAVKVYPAYLKEMMSAKIAVHLPGHGPVSYRLVEAMALGTVVVSTPIACAFPEDPIDGVHYVAFNDDGSNVVEVVRRLLRDDDRRRRIAEQAMAFFDRNFSTESMARRILLATLVPLGSGVVDA
jgi:glycosyltransferase involved in cell wall biosynthesis